MKHEVFITSKAEHEITEAVEWYARIDITLATRFLNEFRTELSSAAQNPWHYQIRYDQVRLLHLKKFPYSVHFQIKMNVVEVLAVFHQHQSNENLT